MANLSANETSTASHATDDVQLPAGYTRLAMVRRTPIASVYSARRDRDDTPVLVKLATAKHASTVTLARLRYEYALLRSLESAPVIRALALEPCPSGLALILEHRGTRTLLDIMRERPFELQERLSLARSLAGAVEKLHSHGVVHKDLQPVNFVQSGEGSEFVIANFDAAKRLSQETQKVDLVTSSLDYIAPEQTGRMNRSVDLRSDLYSLGVVFYELFAGVLPFVSRDPLELVHAHIARTPRAPHEQNTQVPAIVSALILKLLSKPAELRYQTAAGLRVDLDRCIADLRQSGHCEAFPLGLGDAPTELRIGQKLYGRDAQLTQLDAAFKRARGGAVELLLIAGGSGMGKSALAHELNRELSREGRVVSGKFDQRSRTIPYAPILHGCRDLVRALLAQPAEQLHASQQRLAQALGSNGRLIVDLLPELAAVIGPQLEVPELGPSESQHRFEATFKRFLQTFASPAHTLVFFLDDLQWADPASLRLVHLLATDPDVGHLLLLGAYRDNEVGPVHPLTFALASMRKAGARITELELAPLTAEHVTELIADTLRMPAPDARELAELTVRKTLGNPFFIGQFLATLHGQRVLHFDPEARKWVWDATAIQDAVATDNVIDFMLSKLRELPAPTRHLLELASCIGYEFDRQTLCVISEQPATEVVDALWPALQLGLVVPLDDNYRYTADVDDELADGAPLNAAYRFLHDRVQQTAYALVQEQDRQAVHLRIARSLLAASGEEPDADRLFNVVDHLNIGAPLIHDASERKRLATLNLRAGERARASAAYAAASKLLGNCLSALGTDAWSEDYAITYRAHLLRAECDFLDAQTDRAFALLTALDAHAQNPLERAAGGALKTAMLTRLNRPLEAAQCGAEALRWMGVELPDDPAALGAAIGAEFGRVLQLLQGRAPHALVSLPSMRDVEKLACVDLIYHVIPAAFQANQALMALVVLKAIGLMIEHGNAPKAPHLYVSFSLIFIAATGDARTAFEFALVGVELNEQLAERSVTSSACHFVYAAFVSHWARPLSEALDHFERGMKAGIESGDLPHVGYCATHSVLYRYAAGENLEELSSRLQTLLRLLTRNDDAVGLMVLEVARRAISALRGVQISDAPAAPGFDEVVQSGANQTLRVYHVITSLTVDYFLGDYEKVLRGGNEAAALAEYSRGTILTVELAFYRALACAQLAQAAAPEQQTQLLETLRADERMLATWAGGSPENTGHLHALVAAALATLEGAFDTALTQFERAIAGARAHGFIQHFALANELCGAMHLARGRSQIAHECLNAAYQGYLNWGAHTVATAFAKRHPFVTARKTTRPESLDHVLDVSSVMQAAAAISKEIELDAVLRSLITTCLQSAGAETVALALTDESGLRVIAYRRAGEQPELSPCSLEECPVISETVVRYVLRTGASVVLDDARRDPSFGAAEDVRRRQPRSVLAIPLLRGGQAVGVLYLENSVPKAFTHERVRLLEVLAVQAAISVDNARLYGVLTRRNAELTRALQVAEEAARLKSEFLANTSHELRTPLNAIINLPAGVVERLEEQIVWECSACATHIISFDDSVPRSCACCDGEEFTDSKLCFYRGTYQSALRYLDVVRINGEQLLLVVNDLLDMSKLDAGQMKLEHVVVDLSEVANDVMAAMHDLANSRGVQLRLAGNTDDRVTGDRLRLRQVLTNLVANALKFSDAQTEVVVELATDTAAQVMRVRDQGIGIAPENQQKIFDSFYQVDGGHTRRGKGNGLGLSICRRIVELHGGSIRVDSALGHGSTFSVHLPTARSA